MGVSKKWDYHNTFKGSFFAGSMRINRRLWDTLFSDSNSWTTANRIDWRIKKHVAALDQENSTTPSAERLVFRKCCFRVGNPCSLSPFNFRGGPPCSGASGSFLQRLDSFREGLVATFGRARESNMVNCPLINIPYPWKFVWTGFVLPVGSGKWLVPIAATPSPGMFPCLILRWVSDSCGGTGLEDLLLPNLHLFEPREHRSPDGGPHHEPSLVWRGARDFCATPYHGAKHWPQKTRANLNSWNGEMMLTDDISWVFNGGTSFLNSAVGSMWCIRLHQVYPCTARDVVGTWKIVMSG